MTSARSSVGFQRPRSLVAAPWGCLTLRLRRLVPVLPAARRDLSTALTDTGCGVDTALTSTTTQELHRCRSGRKINVLQQYSFIKQREILSS